MVGIKPVFLPVMIKERSLSKSIMVLVFITALPCFYFHAVSQQIIINTNGEKLVMHQDGTWRPTEAGDSVLLNQFYQKTMARNYEASRDSVIPPSSQSHVLKQWNELYFNIKAQEKKVLSDFRAATNAQFKAAELLENALENKKMIEPDMLAMLHDDYDLSVQNLKQAKKNQKAIKKINDEAKKIASLPLDKLQTKMNKLMSRYRVYLANYEPSQTQLVIREDVKSPRENKSPDSKTDDVRDSKPTNTKPSDANPSNTKSSDTRTSGSLLPPVYADVPYRSEPFECRFLMDTIDAATGKKRLEMQPSLIFTHTDPDLRPYFKDKELITCYGRFSRIDAYVYLTIEFQIASSHSQSNFGSLESGSLLRLKLLNGEYVSLYNMKADKGRIDAYSGYTIFAGQYALGKNEIRLLQESGLDKVRILWSTGYEDYDVYRVNFFIDHLGCLLSR
jgi:hypothetical protein